MQIVSDSQFGVQTIVIWVLLLAMPPLLWWFTARVRKQSHVALRPIAAFEALGKLIGRAVEEGKRIHFAMGRTGVGGGQTATAASSLSILRTMADRGATVGGSPLVTVADPVLLLAAQDIVYQAHRRQNALTDYVETDVQMIAPDPAAYAVGAQREINQEGTAANVMVGHLGDEYLLLAESGAQRGIVQVAGSDVLSTQPFVLATSNQALLGEEMYASGAYLTGHPGQIASLYVQDILRGLAVIAILVGILVKTLT